MDASIRERTFSQKVNDFFFAEEVPYGLALVRILLPWVLLLNAVPRWSHAREIYSLDGAPASLAANYGYPNLGPIFAAPVVVALSTALVFLLLALSFGWCTRFAATASFIIYTYFSWTDAISTATKYTVIASHILLLLSLSQCGAIWSVDYWLRNRRHRAETGWNLSLDSLKSPVWPQRLMQLLIAVVYFGAAMTKFHTPSFFSGDQLMWWMMTYIYQQHWLGDYLSQHPVLLVISGYATVIWELAWVLCLWRSGYKAIAIAMGVFFHAMTYPTLGLVSFPLVMIVAYFCHLETHDARQWSARLCMLRKRFEWLSWLRAPEAIRTGSLFCFSPAAAAPHNRKQSMAVFAGAMTALILLGLGAEWLYDPYRVRGANGPLALKPISEAEAERLFAGNGVLREKDKFFALDIGTTIVGEHLLDRRREFQQGQQVFAQVSLTPPHEDLWVECQLYEAGEEKRPTGEVIAAESSTRKKLVPKKMVERAGLIFSRDAMRGTFAYYLGEQFAPGEYFFVVLSRGEQVLKKQITLRSRPTTASAH